MAATQCLPDGYRFPPTVEGVGNVVARLPADHDHLAGFGETGDAVRTGTRDAAFRGAFEQPSAMF